VGASLPRSFLPQEDQGYLLLVMQMPHASSLERTSEAARKIEERIKGIPGIENIVSVSGFDLLGGVMNTYNGVFWITLDDWSERKAPNLQFSAIQGAVMGAISQVPDAIAFPLAPAPIPGVGNTGGFTFILEDRSGGDPEEFTANVSTFMKAIRQRKELSGVSSSYLPDIPQLYVNVDREKASRQGVDIASIYNTLQTFMGGSLVNYFNRFGRQWQVYVAAEGEYRMRAEDVSQFYVRNSAGDMVPLSAFADISSRTGPEYNFRFNTYRATQIFGSAAPGYSSGQAMDAL